MKNTNFTRKILLGVGLLGVVTFAGTAPSAQAAPHDERRDVKEAQKDVKQAEKQVLKERKDYKKADTPSERREEKEDLLKAQRRLADEKRDLKEEKKDLNRPGYNKGNVYHPGNNGYGNKNYGNNGYGNNGYGNKNNGGNYGRNDNRGDYRTIDGRVLRDVSGSGFIFRSYGGTILKVRLQGNEPRQLDKNDSVRISGRLDGDQFYARNVVILKNN